MKKEKMKPKTQITIGLIPLIAIISVDAYCFFFAICSSKELAVLSIETLIFVLFAIALITRSSKIAWWVYYNWWTLQILPLLFALIYIVYLISNKNFLMPLVILLSCGVFVGLPVIFFRIGLTGLERISKVENCKNESAKDDQKQ